MKLTAEDYRESYRALSDDEFLAIDRDELVDVARRVYDAELKRRQLEPPLHDEEAEAESLAPLPIPTDEELVRIGLVTSVDRAIYARRILQDADVPCELDNQPNVPEGTIGVMVPASCAEMAQELLAHTLSVDNQLLARRWLEQEWTPDGLDLTDFSVTVEDLFGEGEKVAARLTVDGVHSASGTPVELESLAIVHVHAGHIAEHWVKLGD